MLFPVLEKVWGASNHTIAPSASALTFIGASAAFERMMYSRNAGSATAARIAGQFTQTEMRHPSVRTIILHLARIDKSVKKPLSEQTGLVWLCDEVGDWEGGWQSRHNIAPAPNFNRKYLVEHAWKANSAVGYLAKEHFDKAIQKGEKGWKNLKGIMNTPACTYSHLTGILVTVGGMPIDLGIPPQILK